MSKVQGRLTYPHVVSTLALFVALGGSAWAIGANSVGSRQLKPNAVTNSDIADNAVRSPEVADGSLLGEDFAAGQLPAGPRGEMGPQGPSGSDAQFDGAAAGGAPSGTYPSPGLAQGKTTAAEVRHTRSALA